MWWFVHTSQLDNTVQRWLSSVQCCPKWWHNSLSFCSSSKENRKERCRGYLKEARLWKKKCPLPSSCDHLALQNSINRVPLTDNFLGKRTGPVWQLIIHWYKVGLMIWSSTRNHVTVAAHTQAVYFLINIHAQEKILQIFHILRQSWMEVSSICRWNCLLSQSNLSTISWEYSDSPVMLSLKDQ